MPGRETNTASSYSNDLRNSEVRMRFLGRRNRERVAG